MAQNKMKEVAKLLGIELEEEFKIDSEYGKYKLSKNGLKYWSDISEQWFTVCWLEELLIGGKKIIKIPKSILDEKEKEYLSNVIKPFRDRVISIIKSVYTLGEYIEINLRHYDDTCCGYSIVLPYFKEGTMYKGLELNKEYTLYELGL